MAAGDKDTSNLVRLGHQLAQSTGAAWEAVYIETPGSETSAALSNAAEALTFAATLGAAVSRIPGATIADAIEHHIMDVDDPHLVLAVHPRSALSRFHRPSSMEQLATRVPRLTFHALPGSRKGPQILSISEHASARSYLISVLAVVATAALAVLLNRFAGTNNLSTLFLFPVVAASARLRRRAPPGLRRRPGSDRSRPSSWCSPPRAAFRGSRRACSR